MKKKIIIILAVALLVAIIAYAAAVRAPGKYDEFAKCLSDNGAKMYGAYWCPHCLNQKEMFGMSWKHVDYIECSLPNRAGQTEFCGNAGIKGYPTWEFSNGERVEGEVTFDELSKKTNCKVNDENK